MSELTNILAGMEQGESQAEEELLPLVYEELRRLAAWRLAQERPGQTLQATALVHEAWLKLTGGEAERRWNDRTHFFAAAAEAMRRIPARIGQIRTQVSQSARLSLSGPS